MVLPQSIENARRRHARINFEWVSQGVFDFPFLGYNLTMRLYLYALLVAVIASLAHSYATQFGWYVTVPGLDIIMHIMVGFGIGLGVVAVAHSFGFGPKKSLRLVIVTIAFLGIVWEIFEAVYGLTIAPVGTLPYCLDTIKDLFDDFLGALAAFFIVHE